MGKVILVNLFLTCDLADINTSHSLTIFRTIGVVSYFLLQIFAFMLVSSSSLFLQGVTLDCGQLKLGYIVALYK